MGQVVELLGAGFPPFAHQVGEDELLPPRVIAPFVEQLGDGAGDRSRLFLRVRAYATARAAGSGLTMKSTLAVFVALGLFAASVQRL